MTPASTSLRAVRSGAPRLVPAHDPHPEPPARPAADQAGTAYGPEPEDDRKAPVSKEPIRAVPLDYVGYAVTFALSQRADCAWPGKATRGETSHPLVADAARSDSPPGRDRTGSTLAGTAQSPARSRTAENTRRTPARRPLPRCTSWQALGSGRCRRRAQPRRRPAAGGMPACGTVRDGGDRRGRAVAARSRALPGNRQPPSDCTRRCPARSPPQSPAGQSRERPPLRPRPRSTGGRHVNPEQVPGHAPAPARYLNGKRVSVVATDFGGYGRTIAVSQLPLRRPRALPRAGCPAAGQGKPGRHACPDSGHQGSASPRAPDSSFKASGQKDPHPFPGKEHK